MYKLNFEKHRLRSSIYWLFFVDLLTVVCSYLLYEFFSVFNVYLVVYFLVLAFTNIWMLVDFMRESYKLKSESYKLDYLEQQRRFVVTLTLQDVSGRDRGIAISESSKVREMLFKKFGGSLAKKHVAIVESQFNSSFTASPSFNEDLNVFLGFHPINDVYYTGILETNQRYSHYISSKMFRNPEPGITLLFVCESSLAFFDDSLVSRLQSLVIDTNFKLTLLKMLNVDASNSSVVCKCEVTPVKI